MSYCRWSSDDFGCDIYAYAAVGGSYMVHVKASRRVGPLARHPLILSLLNGQLSNEQWEDAYRVWNESMDSAAHVPIGLACDGESYSLDTLEDLDAKLRELRAMGYCYPDDVLEVIAEEMAEESVEQPAAASGREAQR